MIFFDPYANTEYLPLEPPKAFILVGHCAADCGSLESTIEQSLPGVTVLEADSRDSLIDHIARWSSCAVLLVNRVLDGQFKNDCGVKLIEELITNDDTPAMMLISNYPDAQMAAMNLGALQGFGKSQLHESQTAHLLRQAAIS